MANTEQEEALKYLKASQQRLADCQRLLVAGEHLALIRSLLEARRLNAQALSALLSGCLRHTLDLVKSGDENEREEHLPELIRLVNFSLINLCPYCRQAISEKLKKE